MQRQREKEARRTGEAEDKGEVAGVERLTVETKVTEEKAVSIIFPME